MNIEVLTKENLLDNIDLELVDVMVVYNDSSRNMNFPKENIFNELTTLTSYKKITYVRWRNNNNKLNYCLIIKGIDLINIDNIYLLLNSINHNDNYIIFFEKHVLTNDIRLPSQVFYKTKYNLIKKIYLIMIYPDIPNNLPINSTECSICLDIKNYNIDFNHPLKIKILPCGHTFHKICINNNLTNVCPICRESYTNSNNIFLGGDNSKQKYLKYKSKYINLKYMI